MANNSQHPAQCNIKSIFSVAVVLGACFVSGQAYSQSVNMDFSN